MAPNWWVLSSSINNLRMDPMLVWVVGWILPMWSLVWCLPQRLRRSSQNGNKYTKREKGQGSISVYLFLYLLLMVPGPYIGCSGFWPLWVVNATRVTPLPSNGTLMGSNGLTVWLGNRLRCLLILNDFVPPSGMISPFTRQSYYHQGYFVQDTVCSSVLSFLIWFSHWSSLCYNIS